MNSERNSGPALLFGILLFRWFDFPTFILANVIVDIRAAFVLFGYINGRLHGPLHTFIFGTILAFVLAAIVYQLKPTLNRLLGLVRLEQPRAWRPIVAAAIVGVFLHICLDSILYADIRPFYPASFNPFFGLTSTLCVYGLCVITFVLGMLAYGGKLLLPRIALDS